MKKITVVADKKTVLALALGTLLFVAVFAAFLYRRNGKKGCTRQRKRLLRYIPVDFSKRDGTLRTKERITQPGYTACKGKPE